MIDIFIPTKIKLWDDDYLNINIISNNFLNLLKNNFFDINISWFDSNQFEWIKLYWDNFSEDLIILCNWLFWEHYFADYDFFWFDFNCLWSKIIWESQIDEKIELIISDISYILNILSWDKLLTNSVKSSVSNKIKQTFFLISGLVYILYNLKYKTQKSIEELNNYDWLEEYEWQSKLLLEPLVTKKLELEASIGRIETQIWFFIWSIKKLII